MTHALALDPLTAAAGSPLVVRLRLPGEDGRPGPPPEVAATSVDGADLTAPVAARLRDGRYRLSVPTAGLAVGPHVLTMTVAGDPVPHVVPFTVTAAPERYAVRHSSVMSRFLASSATSASTCTS